MKFVFNDQKRKNSYGFYILTSGISLLRFQDNPVMLDQHMNYTAAVIGKWKEWEIDGVRLLAVPVFDEGTERGAEISGQVERGFLKSCSMGIIFNHEDFVIIDGELVLTKCELYEVSIVAVPSNANSIRLYAAPGELMTDDQVQSLCLSFQPEQQKPDSLTKPDSMSKILLSAATVLALGLDKNSTDGHEPTIIEAAVARLSKDKATAQAKVLALEAEKEAAEAATATQLVELAIKEGRIPATKKEAFLSLAATDFELAKTTLESIPVKGSLSMQTQAPSGGDLPKTPDEFEQLSHTAKLEFKQNHPTEYKKLFK